jgi:hypothetical protein
MGFSGNGNNSIYSSPGSPGFPPSPTDGDFEDSFSNTISSLPMPVRHSCDSDTDSDDAGEDRTMGLVFDRSATSSTVSLEPQDRLDALQRSNAELGKKLMEAERTLLKRLSEHEIELEEMQSRLEESRSELSATKREEKELRAKEVKLSAWFMACFINTPRSFAASELYADLCPRVGDCEVAKELGQCACIISESAEAVPGAMR